MKKATVLAAAIALFGFTVLDANAQTQATEQQTTTQEATEQPATAAPQQEGTAVAEEKAEEKKEKVTKAQLPAPVQQVLLQDALAEWQISEIYKVAPAAEGEKNQYVILFTNAQNEKAKIRVDEAGAIITDKKE